MVTSANRYEGKTFTSINLGVSIAHELDKTVLLVDADLKKPTKKHNDFAKDFFRTHLEKGLSDYLLNGTEIPELLINPGIERLVLLPGGKSLPNSTEVLGSPRMEQLVREMKSRYADDRIIIFDTSSVLTSADPLVLSRFVDGILLVVEEGRTRTDQLQKTVELLKDRPIIGTIINKVT
jgi:non-specific protein-tyrosine kinase